MRGRPHRPRLRLVRTVRTRRLPFLIAAFLVVGCLVFGVVTLQALVSQTSFKMQELTRRTADLQVSYGRLTLEVAELSSPARIARAATQLGFHTPADGEVHVISGKGAAGAPAAQAAPRDIARISGERP